ncbi:MAG: SAM-dependent chlorinase/fluorinase, partial [Candidatus Methylomirabilis sp.]|nr:SAM-dependent chlorinase/fluorinase [Deltaproteobacteria bacterium]
ELRQGRFLRPDPNSTFHGRDVFSPAAALLASGAAQPAEAGPPLAADKLRTVRLPKPTVAPGRIQGEALLLDKHYGNVWTNIARADVETAFGRLPDRIALRVQGKLLAMPLVDTFGKVARSATLAYFNSRGKLSFAINQGDFAKRYGVDAGSTVVVTASAP